MQLLSSNGIWGCFPLFFIIIINITKHFVIITTIKYFHVIVKECPIDYVTGVALFVSTHSLSTSHCCEQQIYAAVI